MKAVLALSLFAFAVTAHAGELPKLLRQRDFNCADIAEAVNHFVRLGEQQACDVLLTTAPNHSFGEIGKIEFSLTERVGWLCRVLFQSRDGVPLRLPGYGGQNLPYLTMPLKSWPLYPVAHSGESYFILAEGYSGTGIPESPKRYLEYCRKTGVFLKGEVPVPSRETAQRDALALRKYQVWSAVKWTDSGPGTTYTMSEEWCWKPIQKQADDTPPEN